MKLDLDIQIADLYNQELTQKAIATNLGCSLNTVRRRMKALGLKGRSMGSREFTINSHVFDDIDTQEKAYWLGFMLADGCIAKSANSFRAIRVSLQARDERHLLKLAKFFGHEGKLHDSYKDGHHRKILVFNDVQMCKVLLSYGWMNYKRGRSFEILDKIPDDLFGHFIRGYYDGDGCISCKRKRRKDGTLRQARSWYSNISCKYPSALQAMIDRMVPLGCHIATPKQRSKGWDLRWDNKTRCTAFLDWLYLGHTIRLDRKYIRYQELIGDKLYTWRNIHDFDFFLTSDELLQRSDVDNIVNEFTDVVIADGWKKPMFDIDDDMEALMNVKLDRRIVDGQIVPGSSPGNKIVQNFQPAIWRVKLGGRRSISDLIDNRVAVRRAVKALLLTPGTRIYPARFIRELKFAGFSSASILSAPVMMAAIGYFGLKGKWFDPCAGWGNRMLTAHVLGLEYEASDPGTPIDGLHAIRDWLKSKAILHRSRWQDVKWPTSAGFVLTSPPFHNKEDYMDGAKYGTFNEWYGTFLKPLVHQSLLIGRTILHVDRPMREALGSDFVIDALPIVTGNRHKVPLEWFVELTNRAES